jgi:hypothetical protein
MNCTIACVDLGLIRIFHLSLYGAMKPDPILPRITPTHCSIDETTPGAMLFPGRIDGQYADLSLIPARNTTLVVDYWFIDFISREINIHTCYISKSTNCRLNFISHLFSLYFIYFWWEKKLTVSRIQIQLYRYISHDRTLIWYGAMKWYALLVRRYW